MAATGKSFLIDTTKCFACRACQVACKQWNELPAEDPVPINRGGYENPSDLSHSQWLLIHFKESEGTNGDVIWHFVRNSCRHCLEAPCRQAAANPESITVDSETGAVLFEEATQDENFETIRRACPFNIPRQDPATGQLFKCVMCVDRVHNGELPACAKACPSDAILFDDRDKVLDAAEARLAVVKETNENASLLDWQEVRLIILLEDSASKYKLHPPISNEVI
jgi:formate dehydrogenase iron-sulfur subunit